MKTFQHALVLALLVSVISCKDKRTPIKSDTLPLVHLDTLPMAGADLGGNTYAAVDISPMDMSYFPVDYPKIKMANNKIASPLARVVYSRPHLQKRKLFNGILKYNEIWRLGANESTEIEFFKSCMIDGQKVKAGRYILYCIPHPDKWTIILNNNIDTWGLKQDTAMDVFRFDVPSTSGNPALEYFTIVFEKTDQGADLVIAWDDVLVKLPVVF